MKLARSTMVTAAVGAAAALAATGITYASAASAPVPQAAPAAAFVAPQGGDSGKGNENWGKGNEGRGEENRGRRHEGRIEINERSYSPHPGDCITVISGLGAKTLNIRNDSHKTVEVFRGAVCDNGAPIATVGPHSSSFGVHACPPEGVKVEDGVLASFRVVKGHEA
ncbi:hypothetical protein [Streptomyces camelliae]|uniref:Secreted protein n=1 Tax=Streptomyces camelliae TaxID=3004093 RepID=A0ABY7PAW1_9ACTN|nr:hypothetical protein [Streptomyces sp. HUAS 2-6]WBO66700.1 hypothetical protein O1G22_29820 [Streptomyces sp. HUAS 2-6]